MMKYLTSIQILTVELRLRDRIQSGSMLLLHWRSSPKPWQTTIRGLWKWTLEFERWLSILGFLRVISYDSYLNSLFTPGYFFFVVTSLWGSYLLKNMYKVEKLLPTYKHYKRIKWLAALVQVKKNHLTEYEYRLCRTTYSSRFEWHNPIWTKERCELLIRFLPLSLITLNHLRWLYSM